MKKYAVGADIGGSHITCAVIDLEKRAVVKGTTAGREVDNKAPAGDILAGWASAIKSSMANLDRGETAGLGFAMPGPFEYGTGIARFTPEVAKFEHLNGVNVAERLRELLSFEERDSVRFMNDATAFAVGEAWAGKAAGARRSVSVTLGTGFGSAFIDNGLPVVDREDVPRLGCVWHLPFNNGIADDNFSTRWFIRRYAEKSGIRLPGVKEIAARSAADGLAQEVFSEFGRNMGTFLGPWLNRFGAEALVIGGNISASYPLFGKELELALAERKAGTRVHLSGLREDAALLGAARLFEPVFWTAVRPLLPKM